MRTGPLIDGGNASRIRCLRTIVLVLAFGMLAACKTSPDAINAANQLTSVAQQLSAYYGDLEQQVTDTVSLNEIQAGLLGVTFDDSDHAQLDTTREELAKRADMAKALGTLASAYAALAGSKAGADVGTAMSGLASDCSSIQGLPGGPAIPDAIAQASQALVEAIRKHKLKQSSVKVAQMVDAIQQLFAKEAPTYQSINRQRIVLAESLANLMVEKGMVDLNSSLAPALKPFGLNASLPSGQPTTEVRQLAEAEIKSNGDAEISNYQASTRALSNSLAAAAKQVKAVSQQ